MMKVKDIMEPLKSWLTPEMTVQQAIQEMKQTKRGHGLPVNGIVVLDNEMRLVGIVSTKDILRLLIPSHVYLDDNFDQLTWEGLRHDSTEKAKKTRVSDIMSEDVRVISFNDTIMRCADVLLVEQLRRLPVVGPEGRVIGTVYIRDVYTAVTNLLCETMAVA